MPWLPVRLTSLKQCQAQFGELGKLRLLHLVRRRISILNGHTIGHDVVADRAHRYGYRLYSSVKQQHWSATLMKLLRYILASLCLTLAAAAGWIEDTEDGTVIHVKVFALPDPAANDSYSRAQGQSIKEFVRRFPELFAQKYRDTYKADPATYGDHNWDNVSIEMHRFSGIQVEGVETTLLSIAGDIAPDVLYVNFRQSSSYIEQEFLYPLDEYVDQMTEEQKDFRINKKIWPVIKRVGPGSSEEQVWAVPYGGALGKVILYNRQLFDESKIPYPDNNWTWEELFDICKKLTDPANGVYGIQLGKGIHESWYWVTFLWSAGGDCMTYDRETDEWSCVFDSDAAVKALDFYTQLTTEHWTDKLGKKRYGYAYKEDDASVKWDRDQIGMRFSYIDEKLLTTINPDKIGLVPVPFGPERDVEVDGKIVKQRMRGAELNSRMMGLYAGIEDRVIRDAAWEYMFWYDSKDAMGIMVKIMVEGGLGRYINPKYLKMFGYDAILRLSNPAWLEAFEIAIETGMPEPYGRNSNIAYDLMTHPIREAEELGLKGKLPTDSEERYNVLKGLLQKAVARANRDMLGKIPPQEMQKRRTISGLVLAMIVITFVMVFWWIKRIFTAPEVAGGKQERWGFRRYRMAYVMLIPAVLTIFVWQYWPLARGSIMAFQDYKVTGGSEWVGLDNFAEVLWSVDWWKSVWNAARYGFLIIALTFLPPIILAILLQESPYFSLIFRTIYYLPAVITSLVVILLWKLFYEPSEKGVLNRILMSVPAWGYILLALILLGVALAFARRLMYHESYKLATVYTLAGLLLFYSCSSLAGPIFAVADATFVDYIKMILNEPVAWFWKLGATLEEPNRWLKDRDTAMIACVIPMVWAGMGPGCLIYLAALKGISDDFYESGDIDGATFIDKILFIVFPILRPLVIINFIGAFIGAWYGASGNILVMTAGGANTEVADLHIFFKAFTHMRFGPATAMAWLLGFMLIGFTVYNLRILSRLEFKTTGDKG